MTCAECKHLHLLEDGLHICTNINCDNFGGYVGLCCEDECEDGEPLYGGDENDR